MTERITPVSEIEKLGLALRGSEVLPVSTALGRYLLNSLDIDCKQEAIKTGFIDLDKILGGLRPGELIMIASRPSLGKTNLALSIARNVALEQCQAVGYFSLESSTNAQLARLVCLETGINPQRLKYYYDPRVFTERESQRLSKANAAFSEAPLYFDDSDLDLPNLYQKMQVMRRDYGVKLVIIDSIQDLIKNSYLWNKTDIMHYLRQMARDLEVTAILLSNVSHQVDFRKDHVPGPGDLEGLENYPHVVVFLYREDYYLRNTKRKGIADLFIKKNKNGPTGMLSLLYLENIGKFIDFAPYTEDAR